MKKYRYLLLLLSLATASPVRTRAQSYEIQQLLLDVEKLAQLKNILHDLYQGYETLSQGYTAIKNISQGNFNLHQAFLDGLLLVSPSIKNYARVADIMAYQAKIVGDYTAAYNRFKQDAHFNPSEIDYIGRVYGNLFNQSLANLDALLEIITDSRLRMSDAERLKAIDGIYSDTKDKYLFLAHFNAGLGWLSGQRAMEKNNIGIIRALNGAP